MDEAYIVTAGIVTAAFLAGVTAMFFGGATLVGLTPLGAAIYAVVGLGMPQAVIAWENDSRFSAGVAAVAVLGGVGAVGYGLTHGTLTVAQGNAVFVQALLAIVVVAFLAGTARSVYTGYRTVGK